jgi:lysophospholipase L1-like esterase
MAATALEVGVRSFIPLRGEFFRADPVTGIRHIAGKEGRWVSTEFDVVVRINSHGFRDRERTIEKAPGARRVLVLGDSMTEAFQVELEEAFAARLERRLSEGRTVEVLNLGVSALGPAQEYLVFRHRGVPYAPDVVVLAFFTANDFRNSVAHLENKPYLPYPVMRGDELARDARGQIVFTRPEAPGALREFLRTHVASYRFVRDRVRPALTGGVATAASDDLAGMYREPAAPDWVEAEVATRAVVVELARAVRRAGAALVLLVLPGPWEVDVQYRQGQPALAGRDLDLGRPERLAVEWAAMLEVPVVTVSTAFRQRIEQGEAMFFPLDGHLTPAGHAVVAERLAPVVESVLP